MLILGLTGSIGMGKTAAAEAFETAINSPSVNPTSYQTSSHHWYSRFLANVGRLDLSLEQAKIAQEMDTASPILNARLAVAYHFFNDWDTAPQVLEEIKSTYDGPFVLANDYMVFNVTKEYVKVRMAVAPEDVWPPESAAEAAERPEVMQFGGRGVKSHREIVEMSGWLREGDLKFD